MADSKKYNGSTWEHSLRKLTTSTDTFTTLPADIYADGNNATVGISGNTVQNGTPTPDNLIMPQGTGDTTANLFDKSQPSTVGFMREDGTINENNNYRISDYIQLLPNTQYTVSGMNVNGLYPAVCFYTDNKTYISGSKYDGATVFTFTTPSNCKYVLVSYLLSLVNNVMLNLGSTALPYEPWGIKIPISSAGTTTPVYLGEVETTRKIKKYTVNIEFTVTLSNGNIGGVTSRFSDGNAMSGVNLGLCDRALYGDSSVIGSFYINPVNAAFIGSPTDTLNDFKSKYDGASLWYVLATEETGIVNEPLMKIGDYADTVSGITIPTITGKDTVDVETTLKPSEVELTYTGWHDATVKERDGSDWQ